MEGAYGMNPSVSFPTKSTMDLELVLKPWTKINILGKREKDAAIPTPKPSPSVAETFGFDKIGHSMVYSQVEGFIKINFVKIEPHGSRQPYGHGSIKDGHWVLSIRITDFDEEHDFQKGNHVRVRGFMRRSANPIYFSVNPLHDVDLVDKEQMGFIHLLRGVNDVEVKRGAGSQINALEAAASEDKKSKID